MLPESLLIRILDGPWRRSAGNRCVKGVPLVFRPNRPHVLKQAVRLAQDVFMKFSSIFLDGFTGAVQTKSKIAVRFTVP